MNLVFSLPNHFEDGPVGQTRAAPSELETRSSLCSPG